MSSESPQVLSKTPLKLIDNVQNYPSQPCSVAITASTDWAGGKGEGEAHCYLRTSDGQVSQHCQKQRMLRVPPARIDRNFRSAFARIPQTDGWKPGGLVRECDPRSQLSCLAWDDRNQTLFYQLADNTIRETRFDSRWYDTNFLQADVMPGTRIAAICTSDGLRAVVFFQDSSGFLCYRRAWNWNWEINATRLAKAAPNTAIAAVIADLPDHLRAADRIRVYYQDEQWILREHVTDDFGTKWVIGDFFEDPGQFIASMAAVFLYADGPQLRVFYHDLRSLCVSEKCWESNEWSQSRTVFDASCEVYVTAYTRVVEVTKPSVLNLLHVGPDAVIDQHIWMAQLGWLKPSFVEYQSDSEGIRNGSWKGERFHDGSFPSNAWDKRIKGIRIRSGTVVDGICLDFANGTSTSWHGGFGGNLHQTFELAAGEDIVQVLVHANNEYIRALQFRTSKGRASELFGSNGATSSITWEAKDKVLTGFSGTFGKYKPTGALVLTGLQPLWRDP
ncbi:uncharacterized protein LAESUDRAFT_811642 [Laetiporus sulphureus 93-53]|uniref:Jacalin-type lectin domain-containing protein n=1 Tax=Laetiporus sulphureus 93-53 TaxID=1314785 RepID=A0A165F1F6_9APHY|nr:uncharacterized protein LAESUDRAFT_811642 [Laetiporus sulphureus 93-53]KZT08169.1 hypothetical protein LAESUDRAFT_811642 [Laetiporus sulphureus 93-53]